MVTTSPLFMPQKTQQMPYYNNYSDENVNCFVRGQVHLNRNAQNLHFHKDHSQVSNPNSEYLTNFGAPSHWFGRLPVMPFNSLNQQQPQFYNHSNQQQNQFNRYTNSQKEYIGNNKHSPLSIIEKAPFPLRRVYSVNSPKSLGKQQNNCNKNNIIWSSPLITPKHALNNIIEDKRINNQFKQQIFINPQKLQQTSAPHFYSSPVFSTNNVFPVFPCSPQNSVLSKRPIQNIFSSNFDQQNKEKHQNNFTKEMTKLTKPSSIRHHFSSSFSSFELLPTVNRKSPQQMSWPYLQNEKSIVSTMERSSFAQKVFELFKQAAWAAAASTTNIATTAATTTLAGSVIPPLREFNLRAELFWLKSAIKESMHSMFRMQVIINN
uniref:Uncharacterized protein n=1 Tax=Meloidogyne javanica TaxID=6303 RepID=A0A915MFL4_MELJA